MLVDPKIRVLLQEQISIIQGKMMDRAMEVFKKYEDAPDTEKLDMFDTLMTLYNKYIEGLVDDILTPLNNPADQRPLTPVTFTYLVRRLYKGYARFVYDTTDSRLHQLKDEYYSNKEANTEEEPQPTPEQEEEGTEPSFPEESQGGNS